MKAFHEKKIEIICEEPIAERVLEVIESAGARGYTVIPTRGGRGEAGTFREAIVSDSLSNVVIIVIANDKVAETLVEKVYQLLRNYSGIIYTSDVEVLRPDRF